MNHSTDLMCWLYLKFCVENSTLFILKAKMFISMYEVSIQQKKTLNGQKGKWENWESVPLIKFYSTLLLDV